MSKKLKAYEVRDPDEGNCVVVFSEHSVTARREGAAELGCEFEEVESCTRAPQFDEYAPGPVPLHATLASGWWHSCCGCYCTFDADGLCGDLDEDEQLEIEPVEDSKGQAYCSAGCMMASWASRRDQKARECAAIELVLAQWPDAIKVYVHSTGRDSLAFNASIVTLPSLTHGVCWHIGSATATVYPTDVEAFNALYGVQPAHTHEGQSHG